MKRRLQGLLFVVVLLALAGLAVGKYAGAFDDGVPVTLQVERAGTQLAERADVKVRGLNVGKVESVSTGGNGATVELSIDPDKVELIPANVSARLIPKTLFGERYVSLVLPDGPQGPPLAAVEPQDLATTLGALSQALEGRGEELGQTLVRMQELTSGLRPALPDLQEDITQLADFAHNLDKAAPDLLDALEDFTVTSRTVVEQRAQLRELLTSTTAASDDLRAFLDANGKNIIALADSSRPTLETLARYSPEFPCLLHQLAGLVDPISESFGKGTDRPGLRITLEITRDQGKYRPNRDEPRYLDDRGPRCYPIVVPSPGVPPDGWFKDGTDGNDNTNTGPSPASGLGVLPVSYADMGVANSPGERQVVAELLAAQDGTSPDAVPAWSTMLVGPLYRGTEVTVT
jgi:ABC-type transporter Mla subunit MlaD